MTGSVWASYNLFDTDGTLLGTRAFSFTVEDGFLDLGTLVDGGLNDAGWLYLANSIRANGAGISSAQDCWTT